MGGFVHKRRIVFASENFPIDIPQYVVIVGCKLFLYYKNWVRPS